MIKNFLVFFAIFVLMLRWHWIVKLRANSYFSMSKCVSKRPVKGYGRDSRRKKMVLNVDLNDLPPSENRSQESTATSVVHVQVGQVSGQDEGSAPVNERLLSAPIDVEAIDDEVVISSPIRFNEARNRSRRNRVVTVLLDEDSDVHQTQSGPAAEEPITRLAFNGVNHRSRNSASGRVIDCDLYINLESNQLKKRKKVAIPPPDPPRNPVLKEPTFTCAICMCPLREETSTTCGHIFCMKCIRTAITAQKKCPTCRHKLTMNNIHRVYLPSTK